MDAGFLDILLRVLRLLLRISDITELSQILAGPRDGALVRTRGLSHSVHYVGFLCSIWVSDVGVSVTWSL